MPGKTLIFVPTYNERGNVESLCEEVFQLRLEADVLFVDDHSPDGTGDLLDALKARYPRLMVQHRSGKLGIGSAHLTAIQRAYDQGYEILVTMDCDFTHSPADIPRLMKAASGHDMAVGSRFIETESLPGWSAGRKLLTWLGHVFTRSLLGLPYDASSAFRVYNLTQIPRQLFRLVRAQGYAFFLESLFILARNKIKINEIPIILPARASGKSKMSLREIVRGVSRLFVIAALAIIQPRRFKLPKV